MKIFKYLPLSLLLVSLAQAGLQPEQIEQLLNNKSIAINTEIEGKVWPKTNFYTYLEGVSPIQAFAFYVAYKHQKNYVPEVMKSVPIEQKSPTHVIVDYRQNMPWPISDAKYSTGNIIEKISPNSYKISWYQVKSNSSESAQGHAVFSPLKGGTLFSHEAHTEPKSMFGGMLKDIAPKKLRKTLEVIKAETIKAVKERPKLMSQFIKDLNDSFAGKYVYIPQKKKQ